MSQLKQLATLCQSNKMKIKSRGFTLIEIIIYTAIVSVILAAVVNFAWNIIFGGSKTSSWQEVQQNTRFAMERITQAIRSASGINSPSMGNSANSLSLEMANPDLNPTVFDVFEDKIRLFQGTSGPYELTTDELEVTNLIFTNLSYADTSGTIRIELTIEHKNPGEIIEYEASIDITSTVSLRP